VWAEMLEELDSLWDGTGELIKEGVRESMLETCSSWHKGFPEIAVAPGSIEEAVEAAFAAGGVSVST
jgi:hypothetical protein